ncbi:hypothetical protein GCM10007242_04280 [Pigmentiphaga litoralis]|nr:hypothetical protein GCM10007242_04280 [Pigmentiphaga litoralis]
MIVEGPFQALRRDGRAVVFENDRRGVDTALEQGRFSQEGMAESSDRLNYTTKRPTLSVTLINKAAFRRRARVSNRVPNAGPECRSRTEL